MSGITSTPAEGGEAAPSGLLMDQIMDAKRTMEDGREKDFSPETPGHVRVPLGKSFFFNLNNLFRMSHDITGL